MDNKVNVDTKMSDFISSSTFIETFPFESQFLKVERLRPEGPRETSFTIIHTGAEAQFLLKKFANLDIHTVRNLHFLSKNSTLISPENY